MRKVKDAVDLTTNEKVYFKGHAKATYLSDGRNVEDALGEIPSGESDVFKAIYGETTYEAVSEAYNQGKIIHCDYESRCYELAVFTANIAWFSCLNTTTSFLLMLNAESSWSKASYGLENIGNRVDTILADAKPYQYPSAKAVYDFVGKQGVIRQTQTWTQAADMGYDYVMSNLVRGAIPQANIDLFTSAGAIFNEESGYFELNGLTDISYEEMCSIYSAYNSNPWTNQQGMLIVKGVRTCLHPKNDIIKVTSFNDTNSSLLQPKISPNV